MRSSNVLNKKIRHFKISKQLLIKPRTLFCIELKLQSLWIVCEIEKQKNRHNFGVGLVKNVPYFRVWKKYTYSECHVSIKPKAKISHRHPSQPLYQPSRWFILIHKKRQKQLFFSHFCRFLTRLFYVFLFAKQCVNRVC